MTRFVIRRKVDGYYWTGLDAVLGGGAIWISDEMFARPFEAMGLATAAALTQIREDFAQLEIVPVAR